ncbi:MAG: FHA domain-containing protein [Planctomycetota bacterium]|jgi:pSer/pThr/pTyr-binding forkhead associated (FHA) protein
MADQFEAVAEFWEARKHLEKSAFVRTFPYPFLVESESIEPTATDRDFETVSSGSTTDRERFAQSLQVTLQSRLIPVVKDPAMPFPDKITVGRTVNNDLCLRHTSISKFHAYFTVDPNTFDVTVVDAGSTNGTFVNNVRLSNMGKRTLTNGDALSFGGESDYLFLFAADLYSRIQILMRFNP